MATTNTFKIKSDRCDKVFKGGFGPDAPPTNLPFPVTTANITAYELLAFLPRSLQSTDVVYRLISNGGTRHVLWVLINVARDMPEEWHANRCGTIIYKAMRDAGFEGWTVKAHNVWHEPTSSTWNEAILSVAGFRTPAQMVGNGEVENDIPFKNLAAGVRRMPQGDDALDLTRMVQYCVQNPEEEWMYPRDYDKLCNQLGGPVPIQIGNIDRNAFKRWEGVAPAPPRTWTEEEKNAATRAMQTKLKPQRIESVTLGTPASEKQSREGTSTAKLGRKTGLRANKRAKLTQLDFGEESIGMVEQERQHSEQYSRAPADYVAPPEKARAPSMTTVSLAFAAEHDVGEEKLSSVCAFGGPRHSPPYRMLHHIEQPDPSDVSGWAENLRWAWEQRACFWHTFETEGWNESPRHMEIIAKIRQDQDWASEELLELLPDTEDEELEFDGIEQAEQLANVV